MKDETEVKDGIKTSELALMAAGIIATITPILMDKVEAGSVWAVLLGCLGAIAAYILGRSWVKVGASKAKAIETAALAAMANRDTPKP